MATANDNRLSITTGAGNWGIKITKPGFDVDTAEPKDQIFNSKFPCLKILQAGKVSADNASEISFFDVVALPIVVLAFVKDDNNDYYPIKAEFDADKIYLPAGGGSGRTTYYFVCYA